MVWLHQNRFVPYKPFLNTHITVSGRCGLLVVAREHSVVDLFSLNTNFTHFRRLVTLPSPLQIEAICFISFTQTPDPFPTRTSSDYSPKRDKIIVPCSTEYEMVAVAAADGMVRVYSPRTGRQMCIADSLGGGAIWTMCAMGSGRLLIGCEDGSTRLLQLSPDASRLEPVGILDKAPSGSIVCSSCTGSRVALATDDGFVRIIADGRSTGQHKTDGAITALQWSANGDTLFVGLDNGQLIILEPQFCQPIAELSHHVAAIRAIVACGDCNVFVAGVDYRTLHLTRASAQSKWLRSGQRRMCNNDVVGMQFCVVGQKYPVLIQGCVDGSLRVANPFNFTPKQNDRCISGLPVSSIIRSNSLYMAANLGMSIEVYRHGSVDKNTKEVICAPEIVAKLGFEDVVLDFDLHGTVLAVQFNDGTKTFDFCGGSIVGGWQSRNHANLVRFAPSGEVFACEQMASGAKIYCNGKEYMSIESRAFALKLSCSDHLIAISFSDNTVRVCSMEAKSIHTMDFDTVIVAMAAKGHTVYCYSVDHKCYKYEDGKSMGIPVPDCWSRQHDAIQGITADPVYVWSEYGVCKLQLDDKKKKDTDDPFRSVIHFNFINDEKNEAVIVERPWRDVMPLLPPAIQVPKYGQQ